MARKRWAVPGLGLITGVAGVALLGVAGGWLWLRTDSGNGFTIEPDVGLARRIVLNVGRGDQDAWTDLFWEIRS